MTKISRSVQYRYLNRQNAGLGEMSLVEAIRSALGEKRNGDVIGAKARARIADLDQIGQATLLNNLDGIDPDAVVFSGEVVLYKQGFDVPAIAEALDSDDNAFPIYQFQTDGKSKPIEGALYFAVIGDHVGLIASNAVTSRWLERYLTWLLKDAASLIEVEDRIALDSRIQVPGEPGSMGPAKSLTLHAGAVEKPAPDGSSRTMREKRKGRDGTVIEVLRLLGLGPDAIDSIVDDIPAGGSLEGDFLVYIKQGRQSKPISVGTLNHSMRNSDPEDFEIERKGSRTRGKMTHLAESVRVTKAGAGLDPKEAVAKIVEQLYVWNKAGIINLGPAE